MKRLLFCALFFMLMVSCETSHKNETSKAKKQISFALEDKPHHYYVEQAQLWWKEIEKDTTSEDSWYNYYRACRNAQGTADWKEDFVEESPYLRLGKDIVALMEVSIPNTFTLNYVKGSTNAVDPVNGAYLLKAYEMNPDFPGIQSALVTYAVSTHNMALRKKVNIKWQELDFINPGLLLYSRNLLKAIEPGAIVLTQQDNDTYPAWMLQDASGLKPDVMILNIDFLLLKSFRENVFNELEIPPFNLDRVHVDDYRENWKNVVQHLLSHYAHDRPLYIGLTLSPEWYEGFEDKLCLHGLAYKFDMADCVEADVNKTLYEEVWNMDSLNIDFEGYYAQKQVMEMNTNYLKPLKAVYDAYLSSGEINKLENIRQLALKITLRAENEELIERMDLMFKSD